VQHIAVGRPPGHLVRSRTRQGKASVLGVLQEFLDAVWIHGSGKEISLTSITQFAPQTDQLGVVLDAFRNGDETQCPAEFDEGVDERCRVR
jgi:hypothetical protein